ATTSRWNRRRPSFASSSILPATCGAACRSSKKGGTTMFNRMLAVCTLALIAGSSAAQDTVKIGFILPMTGPQQSTGKQISAAVRLFMQQNGDMVAGKKVEVIIKDDGAVPDNSKRLAQELIVNDKVSFLAGFGVTPAALAVAPLATEAKIPLVV